MATPEERLREAAARIKANREASKASGQLIAQERERLAAEAVGRRSAPVEREEGQRAAT